jgi:hypothetical protein
MPVTWAGQRPMPDNPAAALADSGAALAAPGRIVRPR